MPSRSPEEWEILRRSMAMLAPGQPCQLSREVGIDLVEELAQHHSRERRVRHLLAELEVVFAEDDAP